MENGWIKEREEEGEGVTLVGIVTLVFANDYSLLVFENFPSAAGITF